MAYGVVVINELNRDAFEGLRIARVRIRFADEVEACLQQDVILYSSANSKKYPKGYFALAKLKHADVERQNAGYLSLSFEEPRYLDEIVPIQRKGMAIEPDLRLANGNLNGYKASEDCGLISSEVFEAITSLRTFDERQSEFVTEEIAQAEFRIRERVTTESWARSVKTKSILMPIYNAQCAITRQALASRSGLTSGLHACHIMSVASEGPDIISNLILFSPDFHSRYDTGTIDILDDYSWMPVGKYNDDVVLNWVGPRRIFVPDNPDHRLNPVFLEAHRIEMVRKYGTLF